MRGDQPALGARIWPRGIRRSWSDRISEVAERRAVRKREQLELIERAGREQRRAQRAGEFVPARCAGRRWC